MDINAPWVRSLFTALPGVREGQRRVVGWHVHSLGYWFSSRQARAKPQPAPDIRGPTESKALVPGWTRFERLSTWLLSRRLRRTTHRLGRPEAIVYTLPQYAGVAEAFPDAFQVYYAYDGYRFYGGWNAEQIDALEKRILGSCDVAFAISHQLAEDLRQKTQTPVFYSPNAVSESFVSALAGPPAEKPPELQGLAGKIVGCVGQISGAGYDWPLIEALADAVPEANFVFIGPLLEGLRGSQAEVGRVFQKPNVRWLGPRPHSDLPKYISAFDVCFGPYQVNAIKNRSSPLRMYDYLCTNKPVLFTPIHEVCEHREFLEVGATAEECARLIRKTLSPEYRVDSRARRRFIQDNTWEKRAAILWQRICEANSQTVNSDFMTRR